MARPWEIHIPMGEKIKGFFFQNCLSLKEKKKKKQQTGEGKPATEPYQNKTFQHNARSPLPLGTGQGEQRHVTAPLLNAPLEGVQAGR